MKVLLLLSIFPFFMVGFPKHESFLNVKAFSSGDYGIEKIKAYKILKAKCNVCHVKQNRKKIFTLDNMDIFAAKIHKQVFVKKRMPKGKKIKLTNSDITTLKNWLKTLNIK